MNLSVIASWLSGHSADLINAIGVLIDSAIKGSLLVGAAAIASYLLRRQSAAARHAAWTAAVVGHLALPALTLLAPEWRLPFLPAPPWLRAAVEAPAVQTTSANTTTPASNSAAVPASSSATTKSTNTTSENQPAAAKPVATESSFRVSRFSVLAALWILGSVLVLLRLAVGTMQVGRLARYGSRVMDGDWLSLVQRVAATLGISRPLTLLHGDRLGIPVTWGIVYPAVLLPADSGEWPEERRRFVLVHEMAHIKRFDALTQLLAQFALALFWFDPLIWLAAHRMRVEREHACDDYVLRAGTKPSLYAGELLEMVRSLGTPSHETAAPAFAALAMARRSEFEGRMLAILDPRVDRDTLGRRSTAATFAAVALLVIPLAALRPFEQPVSINAATPTKAIAAKKTSGVTTYSCDAVNLDSARRSTSTHISVNEDAEASTFNLSYMMNTAGRCTEATMSGKPKLSRDETEIVSVAPDGLARFRERIPGDDRAVLIVPSSKGGVSYTARRNGELVSFDDSMQRWLARFIPEVMREAAVDVPQRVARLRSTGGVAAVLAAIGETRSTAAKTAHYQELLKSDNFTQSEIDEIARDAARDLASSPSDLRTVLDVLLPQQRKTSSNQRNRYPSAAAQQSIAQSIQKAVTATTSSSEKASLLTQYAAGGDPEAVLLALNGVKDLTSDTDKMQLLTTLAASALTNRRADLRKAFFEAAHTILSDSDMRSVLTAAVPYAHANRDITFDVIRASEDISSSTDQAEVLIAVARQRLLTSAAARDAFLNAAKKLTSSSDYKRVLEAAAEQ